MSKLLLSQGLSYPQRTTLLQRLAVLSVAVAMVSPLAAATKRSTRSSPGLGGPGLGLTITLTATPDGSAPVQAGTMIELDVSVKAQGDPVHPGTLTFFDALGGSNPEPVGTAQLTGAGAGSIRLIAGAGTHQYSVNCRGGSSNTVVLQIASNGLYKTANLLTGPTDGNAAHILYDVVSLYGAAPMGGSVVFTDTTTNSSAGDAFGQDVIHKLGAPMTAKTGAAQMGALVPATGDFNFDGIPDLAVTNLADNTVGVLIGKGDGTFQPAVTYATGSAPYAVVVGDFNNDGFADLAVTNLADNTISVLLNRGNGTFKPQVTYATGAAPFGMTVADFDQDGILDLAVVNQADNRVGVLLGLVDGSFQSMTVSPIGASAFAVVSADFDGDGFPDLAVANAGDNTLSVLQNKGDATFYERTNYATGTLPYALAVGQLDQDGFPDLVMANLGDSTVEVLLNDGGGSGTFYGVQNTYNVGGLPTSVVLLDLDGSGNQSIAAADYSSNQITLLKGSGYGYFEQQFGGFQDADSVTSPYLLAVADFNGDGKQDLAMTTFGGASVGVQLGVQTMQFEVDDVNPTGNAGTYHSYTASYVPSSSDAYAASTSNTVQIAARSVSDTEITGSSPVPSHYGGRVTFTVKVIGTHGLPTGDVYMTDVETNIPVGSASLDGTGVATIRTGSTPLAVGLRHLVANYLGDSVYNPSVSSVYTQNVQP